MIIGIIAGGLGRRTYAENLTHLGLDRSTKYFRFIEDHAYSYGPPTLGETPYLDNLRIWEVYQDDDKIILKNTDEEHTVVTGLEKRLNNISFTFDQNGFPLILWEENKELFLRWFDPLIAETVVTNLGYGHAPFIALETFNENLKPTRIILLVYINANKQLVHRYQTDRWGEEFLIKDGVIDIIGFGPTNHNNLKIVYVNDKNEQDEFVIDTIATPRLGLYEFDTLHARNVGGELTNVQYINSTRSPEYVEYPITMEIDSTTSNIDQFFTYENVAIDDIVEYPITIDIDNTASEFRVKEIGWYRLYPEDVADYDITVTPEIIEIGLRRSSIEVAPEDVANKDITVNPEVQFIGMNPGYVYPENEERYSEWSFINKNSNITLSNDRKTALVQQDMPVDVDGIVKSVVKRSSYKKYVELKITQLESGDNCSVGLSTASSPLGLLSERTNTTWELFSDGSSYHAGASLSLSQYQEGDVIGIALDVDSGLLWWAINGVWLNGGDPETGANPIYSDLEIDEYNIISAPTSPGTRIELNVPEDSWEYSIPAGFESWLDNTILNMTIVGNAIGAANFETYGRTLNALNAIGNVEWSIVYRESPETLMRLSDSTKQLWFKDYNYVYNLTAFGGIRPYTNLELVEGTIPNGVSITLDSPRLLIDSEPDTLTSGELVYKITDSVGKYGFVTIEYDVVEIGITSDNLSEYDKEFVEINLTTTLSGTITWGIAKGSMPSGWTLNASSTDINTITGTATEYGIFDFVLSANDGLNTVYLPVTVTIISMGAYNFDLNVEYVTVDPENMDFNLDVIW